MLESGLGPSDYVKIYMPFQLVPVFSQLKAQLSTNEDNKAVSKWCTCTKESTYQQVVSMIPTTFTYNYYFTFGLQLSSNVWYKLKLKPDSALNLATTGIKEIPVALQT